MQYQIVIQYTDLITKDIVEVKVSNKAQSFEQAMQMARELYKKGSCVKIYEGETLKFKYL